MIQEKQEFQMKRLSSLLAALCCAGMPASAQAAHDLGLQFLYKADANQDGNITKQELRDFRSTGFNRADRDHDGVISLKDVPSRYQSRMKSRFESGEAIAAFDANGDKQVSRGEFETGPTLVFDRADADKDGTVTQSELVAARTASGG
jgi:Ca2+-binding EF-hand superfamily protein